MIQVEPPHLQMYTLHSEKDSDTPTEYLNITADPLSTLFVARLSPRVNEGIF